MLVVESLESALKRGAKIYFEIGGYSANNEAYHLSSPTPEGYGLVKAMKECLKESGIKNDQIDLINPHGSGTRIGDVSESRAIKMILGTPHDKLMNVSLQDIYAQKDDEFDKKNLKKAVIVAHKPNTGHTGVVQGAIECALVAKSFEDNIAPKILNLENPVEPLLNFAMKENVKKEIDIAVKTGYGMGGSCAALLFKRYKD